LKLGRNFTNLLDFNYLTDEEREKFYNGELSVEDVGVLCTERVKRDICGYINASIEIGFSHIELDGAVPNPFLDFTEDEIIQIKEELRKHKITVSLHLPYTFVGASVCAIQQQDREMAVELHKKYLDFAGKLGCISAVIHPGIVPFYHADSLYVEKYKKSLIESLIELADFASSKEIKLHLENETVFHNFLFMPDELFDIVKTVRDKGGELYLNFDIGHWFTVIDAGLSIPENPEQIIEKFPSDFLYELHLNDYIPEKKFFHPPLHRYSGILKKENIQRFFEIAHKKGIKLIVIETAIREKEEMINAMGIIKEESAIIKEILKNVKKGHITRNET